MPDSVNTAAFADMHATVAQGAFVSPRAVDVSAEAVDASVAAVEADRRVAEAFLAEPWPQLAEFLQRGGTSTLLGLIQHTPGERYPALLPLFELPVICSVLESAAGDAGNNQQASILAPCPTCVQSCKRLGTRRYCNEIARHALQVLQLVMPAAAVRHCSYTALCLSHAHHVYRASTGWARIANAEAAKAWQH